MILTSSFSGPQEWTCVGMLAALASSIARLTAGKATLRNISTVWNTSVPEPPTQRKSGRTSMAPILSKRFSAASTRSAAH